MLDIALFHIVGDGTVQTYHDSEPVENRRRLMSKWVNYLSTNDAS